MRDAILSHEDTSNHAPSRLREYLECVYKANNRVITVASLSVLTHDDLTL